MGCGASNERHQAADDHTTGSEDENGRQRDRAVSYAPDMKANDEEAEDENFQEVYNKKNDSDGEETEEQPTKLAVMRSIRVVKSRIKHGINGDADQFDPEPTPAMGSKGRHAVRVYCDDMIQASVLQSFREASAKIAGGSTMQSSNVSQLNPAASVTSGSSMFSGPSSSATPTTPQAVRLQNVDSSQESPQTSHMSAPTTTGGDLLLGADSLSNNGRHSDSTPTNDLAASTDMSASAKDGVKDQKLSSHFFLPPMELHYALHMKLIGQQYRRITRRRAQKNGANWNNIVSPGESMTSANGLALSVTGPAGNSSVGDSGAVPFANNSTTSDGAQPHQSAEGIRLQTSVASLSTPTGIQPPPALGPRRQSLSGDDFQIPMDEGLEKPLGFYSLCRDGSATKAQETLLESLLTQEETSTWACATPRARMLVVDTGSALASPRAESLLDSSFGLLSPGPAPASEGLLTPMNSTPSTAAFSTGTPISKTDFRSEMDNALPDVLMSGPTSPVLSPRGSLAGLSRPGVPSPNLSPGGNNLPAYVTQEDSQGDSLNPTRHTSMRSDLNSGVQSFRVGDSFRQPGRGRSPAAVGLPADDAGLPSPKRSSPRMKRDSVGIALTEETLQRNAVRWNRVATGVSGNQVDQQLILHWVLSGVGRLQKYDQEVQEAAANLSNRAGSLMFGGSLRMARENTMQNGKAPL